MNKTLLTAIFIICTNVKIYSLSLSSNDKLVLIVICLIQMQGLTWEECQQRCPDGVVPACHNAPGTVTISGPSDKVHNFVHTLKEEGIFAKEVNSSGVAFHSPVMEACAPSLKASLKKVRVIPS